MNPSVPRLPTVAGIQFGNRVATAIGRACETAARVAARTFASACAYLRRRWREVLEDLRPYECDTVQKRKEHREAWLADSRAGNCSSVPSRRPL